VPSKIKLLLFYTRLHRDREWARLIIAFILMWPGAKCYTQRHKKPAQEREEEWESNLKEGVGRWVDGGLLADLRPAMRFTISRPGRTKYFQTDGVRARRNKCTFNGPLGVNLRPRPLIHHWFPSRGLPSDAKLSAPFADNLKAQNVYRSKTLGENLNLVTSPLFTNQLFLLIS